MAFAFNLTFLLRVRRSLRREMPFSVRTRTRRHMLNYVLMWVVCWGPYIANSSYFTYLQWVHGFYPDETNNISKTTNDADMFAG